MTRAGALLEIAGQDTADSILTATFDALDDPARFPELLDATARNTDRVATLLQPLATIAVTAATHEGRQRSRASTWPSRPQSLVTTTAPSRSCARR